VPRDEIQQPAGSGGGVRYELLGGRVRRDSPWCVECNSSADSGSHSRCRAEMDWSLWTPCLSCLGGGVAVGGGSCPDCLGLGFWRAESEVALFGGYTVLAEAYREMRAAQAPAGRCVVAGGGVDGGGVR